ncbi:MAG: hypothetical protein ACI4U0_07010 [Candidatus Aphodocola sp.]
MRQKITYIASDGKEFDDKNAAIEYENLFKKWEQNKNNAIKLGSDVIVSRDNIIEYFKKLSCDSIDFYKSINIYYNLLILLLKYVT